MKRVILITCFVFLVVFSGSAGAVTNFTGCGTLSIPGETYVLSNDINASGTCITIGADDITLDGAGYSITGSGSGYGVYLNEGSSSVAVKNLNVNGFEFGIFIDLFSNNITLTGNTVNSNYLGIYLPASSNITLTGNTVNSSYWGIYLSHSSNNTLINNTANSNNNGGIYLYSSSNITLTDNTANSNNKYGIYLKYSSNNILTNNTAKENDHYDVYVSANSDARCNNVLKNNTGSGDRPIKYFNYSVSLQNETLSELILCNADNSSIYNVTIDGSATKKNNMFYVHRTDNSSFTNINSTNNYMGISLSSSSNNTLTGNAMNSNTYNFDLSGSQDSYFDNSIDTSNTVDGKPIYYVRNAANMVYNNSTNAGTFYCIWCDNVTIKDLTLAKNSYGVFFWSTNNSKIENVNVSDIIYGIQLRYSSNNTLTNNNASNSNSGISLYSSSSNTLVGNNANLNTGNGISLYSSSNNILINNAANSNNRYGISLYGDSKYNTLTGNTVNSNNNYGTYLWSSSNSIYNNLFNNTNNFYPSYSYYSYNYFGNIWNTTKTSGTNIVGGPYLGGNFWAKPDGTGFSDTCTDADSDGICDSSYTLPSWNANYPSGNVDYLPLSLNFTVDTYPPARQRRQHRYFNGNMGGNVNGNVGNYDNGWNVGNFDGNVDTGGDQGSGNLLSRLWQWLRGSGR